MRRFLVHEYLEKQHNVFNDNLVREMSLLDPISHAFNGEQVAIRDVDLYGKAFDQHLQSKKSDFNLLAHDLVLFPIRDANGKQIAMATIYLIKHAYQGRREIVDAKRWIESNWQEHICNSDVAKHANLSLAYFSRLFKRETGKTVCSYIKEVKIEKIKELLRDSNLTIADTFSACGVDYHGHYASVFRDHTGMSPSEYRESVIG